MSYSSFVKKVTLITSLLLLFLLAVQVVSAETPTIQFSNTGTSINESASANVTVTITREMTNLIPNSDFETNTNGWYLYTGTDGTLVTSTDWTSSGSKSMKISLAEGITNPILCYSSFNFDNSISHTLEFDVYSSSDIGGQIQVQQADSPWGITANTVYHQFTYTSPVYSTNHIKYQLDNGLSTSTMNLEITFLAPAGASFYIDNVKLYASPHLPAYINYAGVDDTGVNGTDYTINNGNVVIATVGDSITNSENVWINSKNGYAGILSQKTPNAIVKNFGVNGYKTSNILENYSSTVYLYTPDYVSLMIGTNDVSIGAPLDSIKTNITAYINMLNANGTSVIVFTVPPSSLYDAEKNQKIRDLNTWLKATYNAIDLWAALKDPANQNQLNSLYDSGDHLHINYAGCLAWSNLIDPTIFTPKRKILVFENTTASRNITVNTLSDNQVTNNKTFGLELSSPINATVGLDDTNTVTILETDKTSFTITASSTTVTEADTTIILTVTKSIPSDFESTIDIATADGTATTPGDYTALSQTLTFNNTTSTLPVTLSIKRHESLSTPINFKVSLSNPTGNATLGEPYEVTITINPNAKDVMGARNNTPKILAIFGLMFIVPIIIIAGLIITMMATREVNPILLIGAVIGIGLFFIVLIIMLFLAGDIMTIINP